ncbi:DUF1624 domain-containing protein [Mucilaginibacter ginkgonis]|uniref:DUF1624 domain-containing protein n=1 Tax=Mucilaginibacter ginkgonis TaxID=2682091 RepID=A0A6I4I228_9SPHI|nr:heparan-alpha-glucosaminide N-acetyltransferase domain-containing protein [Mucilaginibacter ginkgonis]QQL49292.1 DUF1624 domain-containing protein [Mucilaginibacter ginkgonis]
MQAASFVNKQRIASIDILRGIVMVIMALDHVRDFFSNVQYDPLDLTKTSPLLFFTRWITHFCAPTFVMLSGVSAYLSLSKKASKNERAAFLLKRGLWLIFLEFTLIGFGWSFDPGFHVFAAQVIWAIGCSMLFLSLLIFIGLRPVAIGIVGLLIVFGHNMLDGITAVSFGKYQLCWLAIHQLGFYATGVNRGIFMLYPVLPWMGIMATGYFLGTVFKLAPDVRRKLLFTIGGFALFLFLFMRWVNIYGDPRPWLLQDNFIKGVGAYVSCQKYPPSLLYTLMTLSIAIISLALLEKVNNPVSRFFTVYGRVPFFYYVPHIYIIHLTQVLLAIAIGFDLHKLSGMGIQSTTWGFGLPVVYLIWIFVVAVLYFPCRWFMKVKQRRKDWWLSYL